MTLHGYRWTLDLGPLEIGQNPFNKDCILEVFRLPIVASGMETRRMSTKNSSKSCKMPMKGFADMCGDSNV